MLSDKRRFWFRFRGWIGIASITPVFAVVLLTEPAVREGSWPEFAMDTLGWAALVAGAAFRFWSILYVGGRKRRELITEGPYSVCRNPLYVGSFLLATSGGLFLKSATFTGGLGLAVIAYALGTVPAEEVYLQRRHGEPYARYCRAVKRFWPRLSSFHTGETIEVKVCGLRREGLRALGWIWIPSLGEAVSHLRAQPWWPHLFLLP